MKRFFLRTVSFFIICAVILVAGGCKSDESIAMSLTYEKNTTTISSNVYSYYLSYNKTMMLAEFYLGSGYTQENLPYLGDMPEFWSTQIAEGVTWGDYAKYQAENQMAQFLAVAAYCKENAISLSKDEINNVDIFIKELTKANYGNSKSAFNSALLKFNINDSIYREIKRLEALLGPFSKYIYGEGTGVQITDEMINSVYQELCVRFKHIVLFKEPGTRDVDNNPEKYSNEELEDRKSRVDGIYERIINGEDFEEFLSESEDPYSVSIPDGYTFSEDSTFIDEVIEAAFDDMKIGEVRKIESDTGFHIIKKYELLLPAQSLDLNESQTRGTTTSWTQTITRIAQSSIMRKVLEPYLAKIEIKSEETELFSAATSAVMLDCMSLMY